MTSRRRHETRRATLAAFGSVALAVGLLVSAPAGAATASSIEPSVTSAPSVQLDAVSCPTATYCVAVGGSQANIQRINTTPVVEAWNGTSWNDQPVPAPATANRSYLSGVSCTSPSSCMAVGTWGALNKGVQALAEYWNGTAWSILPVAGVPGDRESLFSGVSCTSATSCTAVGNAYNPTTMRVTVGEYWNGTTWSLETTVAPPTTIGALFTAVSCPTSTFCTAVGYYYPGSTTEATLAEEWNGTSWTMSATPDPAGSTLDLFAGVSCPSASDCVAIGGAGTTTSGTALLAAWNGTDWATQTAPKQGGDAISCPSTTACLVVGFDGAAEAWNGTVWTLHNVHLSTAVTEGRLTGVSCLTATDCTAVGWIEKNQSSYQKTLGEAWNGTYWKFQTTPW